MADHDGGPDGYERCAAKRRIRRYKQAPSNAVRHPRRKRASYFALLSRKLKLASCPAAVTAAAWQPMHVPP